MSIEGYDGSNAWITIALVIENMTGALPQVLTGDRASNRTFDAWARTEINNVMKSLKLMD